MSQRGDVHECSRENAATCNRTVESRVWLTESPSGDGRLQSCMTSASADRMQIIRHKPPESE